MGGCLVHGCDAPLMRLGPKVFRSLTNSNFPQTVEDIDALVIGMYANFKANSGGVYDGSNDGWTMPIYASGDGWWAYSEFTSDEMMHQSNQTYKFNWSGAWDTYGTYSISRNITRCTFILDQLEKVGGLPEAAKAQKIAEVKTLRAWLMFCFYDLYGPVSCVLEPEGLSNIVYTPRPTKEVYFNRMVSDLQEALPYLYDKTNGTENWGRVNKGIATMLLMKAYMNDHQYDKALPYAESMKTMGYTLSEDYKDVFSNEMNDETVWAVPGGELAGNEYAYYLFPPNCITFGKNFEHKACPTHRWGGYLMPWDFYDTYDKADARLEVIADSYKDADGTLYTRPGGGGASDDRIQQGAIPVKYLVAPEKYASGNTHIVAFRYADVLLSLAEIENELNGPTDKALGYLKQITDRVGVTHTIPADIQSSKEKFKEFLLMERGRELFMEGWRRQDLIRFGKYIEFARNRGCTAAKDHMVLFPIPPKVITESGGVIEQNPGY